MLKLNNHKIIPTIFPDKTSQVWNISEIPFAANNFEFFIEWEFESESEISHLVQLCDLIRHKCAHAEITLLVPYLPYARQDKDISNDSTFALHSFAKIINMLEFYEVMVVDPHSKLPSLIIDRLSPVFPEISIENAINMVEHRTTRPTLAFPDEGAWKRYKDMADGNGITGHKTRDQSTGYITDYRIEGDPSGKEILIVDDICDGGMTFKLMARALYKQGATSVHLHVTHGIFSKGLETLREDNIKRIFTYKGEVE